MRCQADWWVCEGRGALKAAASVPRPGFSCPAGHSGLRSDGSRAGTWGRGWAPVRVCRHLLRRHPRGWPGPALGSVPALGQAGQRGGGGPTVLLPRPGPALPGRPCALAGVRVRGRPEPRRPSVPHRRGSRPRPSQGRREAGHGPSLHHVETGLSRFSACAEMGFRPAPDARPGEPGPSRGCSRLFSGPSVAS